MTERIAHPLHDEAYIYKRPGSQFWFMDYKNANGNRTRKSTKTTDKRQALQNLSENIILIKKIKTGEISVTESKKITVKKVVAETIDYLTYIKPQIPTYKVYIRELKNFAEIHGENDINEINRQILRAYFSQNFSKSRLGMIRTAIRTMFILCEDSKYINEIPEFPKNIRTKDVNKREGMEKDQVQAIIKRFYHKSIYEKLDSAHRKTSEIEKENARIICTLLILLYHTGARIGEIRHLKPSDVYHRYDESGQLLAGITIRESKTVPRKILIPINVWMHLRQEQEKQKLGDNDYYFLNRINSKISADFNKITTRDIESNPEFYKGIGVKDFCLYRLRHTFIIERLLEKKSIFFIAQHCGTSVKMIEKHYADYIATVSYELVYPNQTYLFNKNNKTDGDRFDFSSD